MRYLAGISPAFAPLLGVCLFGIGAVACARQSGLKSPGVERVSLSSANVIRASADVVNARCTKGKKTWDDGTPYDPAGTKTARCCTIYRAWRKVPFTIWIADGEEECWVHEFCHIEQFLSPRPDHSRCHDFGLGKPRKRT